METEWFYKPIEGYNRRYIRVGEFHQIRWCQVHDCVPLQKTPDFCWVWSTLFLETDCVIVDKWLEV